MTTTTTSHGTYTHGTPERSADGGWHRVDQWESDADGGGMMAADLFHCTGPDDDTPRHDISRGYLSTCSWCWLGYGHTVAEHARSVGGTLVEWTAVAAAPGPPDTIPVHFLSTGTEAGDEQHARAIAEAYWHRQVFSVTPAGCTGLAPNVHMGRACPVHPDA